MPVEFWLKFHCSLFPKGPIDNMPALGEMIAWRWIGDKPLWSSELMMAWFTDAYVSLGLNELKLINFSAIQLWFDIILLKS